MATTEQCTLTVYNYFKNKYPNRTDIELIKEHPFSVEHICAIPKDLESEAQIFIDAFAVGYNTAANECGKKCQSLDSDLEKLKTSLQEKAKRDEELFAKLKDDYTRLHNMNEGHKSLLKEAYARVHAADTAGYQRGYKEAYKLGQGMGVKLVEAEARKWKQNYLDVVKGVDLKITEAKNIGYSEGVEAGRNAELAEAIIPSDAFDIEVFAIQPADDGIGLQAFVGYKFKHGNSDQFRFIQVKHSVTNPSNKYGNNGKNIENASIKNNG